MVQEEADGRVGDGEDSESAAFLIGVPALFVVVRERLDGRCSLDVEVGAEGEGGAPDWRRAFVHIPGPRDTLADHRADDLGRRARACYPAAERPVRIDAE